METKRTDQKQTDKLPDAQPAIHPECAWGIEISIDSQTAKWDYRYFAIMEGRKRQVNEHELISRVKTGPLLEKAVEAIKRANIRKKFAALDLDTLDIIGFPDKKTKKFRVIATSDSGDLRLELNHSTGRFVQLKSNPISGTC